MVGRCPAAALFPLGSRWVPFGFLLDSLRVPSAPHARPPPLLAGNILILGSKRIPTGFPSGSFRSPRPPATPVGGIHSHFGFPSGSRRVPFGGGLRNVQRPRLAQRGKSQWPQGAGPWLYGHLPFLRPLLPPLALTSLGKPWPLYIATRFPSGSFRSPRPPATLIDGHNSHFGFPSGRVGGCRLPPSSPPCPPSAPTPLPLSLRRSAKG